MAVSPRAIALGGVGFGPIVLALDGFAEVSQAVATVHACLWMGVAAIAAVEVSAVAHACVSLTTAEVAAVVITEATVNAVVLTAAAIHAVTLTDAVVATCTITVEDC